MMVILYSHPPLLRNNDTIVYDYSGSPKQVTLRPGVYQFECWGARSGRGRLNNTLGSSYGLGAYVCGKINKYNDKVLFLYVGCVGGDAPAGRAAPASVGGWNGGGDGGRDTYDDDPGGAGGGASDIRLVSGNWDDIQSLRSRIMVAAGAGGPVNYSTDNNIQYGGSLSSINAHQVSGYAFGYGDVGTDGGNGTSGGGGSGGGYYGGMETGTRTYGAGGSSFISGHPGCNAIKSATDQTHTGQPNHYSGLIFTDTQMIAGNQSMPNPRGSDNITGNSGHGFIRITVIDDLIRNIVEIAGRLMTYEDNQWITVQ